MLLPPEPQLITLQVFPYDGNGLSITTDDPNEAARWMLRICIMRGLFRNLNPVNPIRDIHLYGNFDVDVLTRWVRELRPYTREDFYRQVVQRVKE